MSFLVCGQESNNNFYKPDSYNFDFQENSYQYLLSDNVNIRTEPSTSSNIVSNLPIGTRLRILERLSNEYIYNNISFPWYMLPDKHCLYLIP